MSDPTPTTLEEAIRHSGESWLIDWYSPPSGAIAYLRRTLDEVDQLAKLRLEEEAPSLKESALLLEYRRNSLRVKGFFQALGASCTPIMLLMAWRVIQGLEIKSIQLSHLRQQSF